MKFLTLFIAFLILSICNVVGQTVFTVTNTNDSGAGSLRQAMLDANGIGGTDTIAFDIPGAGPHTIQPLSALPFITDPIVIDGTTEPDFAGTPIIELDGTSAGSITSGLRIFSGNSTVRGLVINRFGENGILLESAGNVIHRNYIGTDVTGTVAIGNGLDGVKLNNASNNTIGGTTAGAGNVISGNHGRGIWIFISSNNTISGNYIGTDSSGTTALGNVEHGIVIGTGSQFNIIGGTTEGERNIISGNGETGVAMWNNGTSHNTISGNYIGTDVTGTVALGNMSDGIWIIDNASSNTVGGTTEGERNIISGNNAGGMAIFGEGTSNNIVIGNYIGTDVTGTTALGNARGITIMLGASSNTIGGATEGARNVISGNGITGLLMMGLGFETSNNTVSGNFIGTDYTGMTAIPNLFDGIAILLGASNNIIGGTSVGAGNVISGNQFQGINIGLDSANGNIVQGNYIGTDATGEGALGNGTDGVSIFLGAVDNLVGGDEAGAENVIAFNVGAGILLNNTSATVRNRLSRNSIFSNDELGIDLSVNPDSAWRDGITDNDPGDPDTGPNNLQNFPVIISADIDGNGDLLIGYNVDSEPTNSTYPLTIEFFESDTSGQGETFVGADQYTVTDFNNGGKTVNLGNAVGLGITDGDNIVATTTDSVGNTSEFSSLDTVVTDLAEIINNLPKAYALYQNYPNPFNPVSKIKYDIPKISFVTIKVYDVLGSEIATLVNEEKPAGSYEVDFNAIGLPSGVYFYHLKAGQFIETKKMVLMK